MTAPTPRVRRSITAVVACIAIAVLLGACGRAVDSVPAATGSQPAVDQAANSDAGLTTVPPLDEQYPELFNEQGCAIGSITPALDDLPPETRAAIIEALPPAAQQQIAAGDEIDLNSIPSDVLGSLLEAQRTAVIDCNMSGETPDTPREFYGYLGANAGRYAAGVADARTTESDDGHWRATGHAVAPDAGGTVTITATLHDRDGDVIDVVSVSSPVRGVQAGEPVPFQIDSEREPGEVATVDYRVIEEASPEATVVERRFTILLEGIVADGDQAVILGSVVNESGATAEAPAGVVAINANNIDLVEFVVTEPGTNRALTQLEPGFSGTFEVVVDDPSHELTSDDVEVWVFAS